MANAAGMLKESIWRDREFRALPRSAQATYAQLISQKDLDRAGMQPLQVSKWAKGCNAVADSDICDDLKVLEQHRFVFVDEDTDELFVRSYMRHCDVARYPNILKNALRCAGLVASEKIRYELAKELRRLRRADADRVADAIEPADFDLETTNSFETESNPSGTVPERLNGSGTLTEPQGYGYGSGSVTLGSSQVGKTLDETRTAETDPTPDRNEPPPERCPKHIDDPNPPPCGACAGHRRHHERWTADQLEHQAAERRQARAAIDDCEFCDDNGMRELPDGAMFRCDHRMETAAEYA